VVVEYLYVSDDLHVPLVRLAVQRSCPAK
jgi:hypothetical protein